MFNEKSPFMKSVLLIILLAISQSGNAQSAFLKDFLPNINPGFSALNSGFHSSLSNTFRQPFTYSFAYNQTRLNVNSLLFDNNGIGLTVNSSSSWDEWYVVDAHINYNHQFSIGDVSKLSVGTGLGANSVWQRSLNDYGFWRHATALSFRPGAVFQNRNIQVGFSVSNLTEGLVRLAGNVEDYDPQRIYHLVFAYRLRLTRKWTLIPLLHLNSNTFIDLNVKSEFGSKTWAAFNYSYETQLGLSGGMRLKGRYNLGYGIDFVPTFSSTRPIGINHSLLLGVQIR